MDARRFHDLARATGARRSRRGAVQAGVAGAVALLRGRVRPADAVGAAASWPPGAGCRRAGRCLWGVCRRGARRRPDFLERAGGQRRIVADAGAHPTVSAPRIGVERQGWPNGCFGCESLCADIVTSGCEVTDSAPRDGKPERCPRVLHEVPSIPGGSRSRAAGAALRGLSPGFRPWVRWRYGDRPVSVPDSGLRRS